MRDTDRVRVINSPQLEKRPKMCISRSLTPFAIGDLVKSTLQASSFNVRHVRAIPRDDSNGHPML